MAIRTDWRGVRVTVLGLGRFGGGVGVTRWLAGQGARVRVADREPAERLADSVRAIADCGVECCLGEERAAHVLEADVVVVNPAVPDAAPLLAAARAAGVPITTEINLFLERCQATTIAVSGSVGKSTITAMIGHILEGALPGRRTWVGGNIGRSLLDELPRIGADDLVVLELSSFQLQRTPAIGWSPHVAVLAAITPNHLDWHGDFSSYAAAKLNLLRWQNSARDHAILEDQPELAALVRDAFGDDRTPWRYGLSADGPYAERVASGDRMRRVWREVRLNLPGAHNLRNAAAALAACACLDVADEAAVAALASFRALPHRLEIVAERDGVLYYNDSKSTTPEATVTALHAIERPILVILGGYDKGIDLRPAADCAARRARFCACIGATGPGLVAQVRAAGGRAEFYPDLRAAVTACQAQAEPGDAVLLSPGCASWGSYPDYRARGEEFARLVQAG